MGCTELSELIEPLTVIASAENVYAGIREVGGIQNFPFYLRNPHLWQHQQEFYNVGQYMSYNHIYQQQQNIGMHDSNLPVQQQLQLQNVDLVKNEGEEVDSEEQEEDKDLNDENNAANNNFDDKDDNQLRDN